MANERKWGLADVVGPYQSKQDPTMQALETYVRVALNEELKAVYEVLEGLFGEWYCGSCYARVGTTMRDLFSLAKQPHERKLLVKACRCADTTYQHVAADNVKDAIRDMNIVPGILLDMMMRQEQKRKKEKPAPQPQSVSKNKAQGRRRTT